MMSMGEDLVRERIRLAVSEGVTGENDVKLEGTGCGGVVSVEAIEREDEIDAKIFNSLLAK